MYFKRRQKDILYLIGITLLKLPKLPGPKNRTFRTFGKLLRRWQKTLREFLAKLFVFQAKKSCFEASWRVLAQWSTVGPWWMKVQRALKQRTEYCARRAGMTLGIV